MNSAFKLTIVEEDILASGDRGTERGGEEVVKCFGYIVNKWWIRKMRGKNIGRNGTIEIKLRPLRLSKCNGLEFIIIFHEKF